MTTYTKKEYFSPEKKKKKAVALQILSKPIKAHTTQTQIPLAFQPCHSTILHALSLNIMSRH